MTAVFAHRGCTEGGLTENTLDAFAEAARLPGLSGLFDSAHNPLFRLPVLGDGAIALREFFQAVVPETGAPAHDFTDSGWGTRFLGELYQDLSEEAQKHFALRQTPEFVEAWILDRTLEPAIREFGFREVRVIDPACGSGPFLLGGFARVLREWERLSQAAFARYLNLTVGYVSQLERGVKQPKGPALVLLNVIRRKGLGVML